MRKLLVIICLEMFVFSCSPVHKRNSNDSMGQTDRIENNLLLNETESVYLNKIFDTTRKDFDFTNKKVGFLTGSSGKTLSSKEHYFDMHRKHSTNENYPCDNGSLYIFNAAQKEENGGYDAVIAYWCKVLLPVEQIIKRLKKNDKKQIV
jgi:hypothetical protein